MKAGNSAVPHTITSIFPVCITRAINSKYYSSPYYYIYIYYYVNIIDINFYDLYYYYVAITTEYDTTQRYQVLVSFGFNYLFLYGSLF